MKNRMLGAIDILVGVALIIAAVYATIYYVAPKVLSVAIESGVTIGEKLSNER